jgi:uncharacterized damage-inducible protein DinB
MARTLVDQLGSTPEELAALIDGAPAERLATPAREGEWTPAEVLAHLADHEVIVGARIRLVLSLQRPRLPVYGQAEFTRRFGQIRDSRQSLDLFTTNRRATLAILQAAAPLDWERRGLHPVRGEETLRRTVEFVLRHDRGHLRQIREALQASEISSARLGSQ